MSVQNLFKEADKKEKIPKELGRGRRRKEKTEHEYQSSIDFLKRRCTEKKDFEGRRGRRTVYFNFTISYT